MAQRPKLSPEQRAEVIRRLAAGEGVRALAREFGVGPATIMRISDAEQPERVRSVARQVADAQTALAALPVSQQYAAVSLAEKLRNISASMASAAELGAKTAHHLHELAHGVAAKVTAENLEASVESLRHVGGLVRVANDANMAARDLLALNKGKDQAPDASRLSDEELHAEIAALQVRVGPALAGGARG